jgi:aminomethyltransferase
MSGHIPPPLETRIAAQEHFRRPQLRSPFHERIAAMMGGDHWYDWAGYSAPSLIRDEELEYFAIRSQAALFDMSPMTKYRIEGVDAQAFLNRLTLRDVARLRPGRVQYTAWCDDDGLVLDDGTLFRLEEHVFRLCCQERHLPWLLETAEGFDVSIREETGEIAALALQGPTSAAILRDAGFDIAAMKPFDVSPRASGLLRTLISRTGFTADLGYEVFIEAGDAPALWDLLMQAGRLRGITPIGYNALNRARIEAGFIVANADFITAETALRADRTRMPDEIGLGWLADMGKGHFNGKRAIARARAQGGPRHVLVGLEIDGNEPATGAIVYHRGKTEAGIVTAATWSPMAKRNIAIASLDRPYGQSVNDDLWVEIYALRELRYHKMMKRARIVERPFVRLDRRLATPPADF